MKKANPQNIYDDPSALHTPFIALFGGTFDPVHLGHLHVAEQVCQKLPVSEVRFLPCYQSPTRGKPIANVTDRLAMLKLAIAPYPNYCVDDREIKRNGISYTIDTLRELKREQKENNFGLILGGDAVLQFQQWKEWQHILSLCQLIVIDRPYYPLEALAKEITKNSIVLEALFNFTSATTVREKIAKRQEVSEFLPLPVYQYILQHRLYLPEKV